MHTQGETMRSLHLDKTGLRGLTIAESFGKNTDRSILAGVVMRSDFIIDGLVFGSATLAGDDATDAILDMYLRLDRSDINYILLSGMILSLYNIVDISKMYNILKIPIIGLSYRESSGIKDAIRRRFEGSFEFKINAYQKLGNRTRVRLKTAHDIFIRTAGCTTSDARYILDILTLHGSVPEPVRVSRMAAKAFDAF